MTHQFPLKVVEPVAASQQLLTVDEAGQVLRLGRTVVFDLIKSGALESVKIGRCRRIPSDAVTRYVDGLRAAQNGAGAA